MFISTSKYILFTIITVVIFDFSFIFLNLIQRKVWPTYLAYIQNRVYRQMVTVLCTFFVVSYKLFTMVLDGGCSLALPPPYVLKYTLLEKSSDGCFPPSIPLFSPPQPAADCLPPVFVNVPLRPWRRGHN